MVRTENAILSAVACFGILALKLVLLVAAMSASAAGLGAIAEAIPPQIKQQIGYVLLIGLVAYMSIFAAYLAGEEFVRATDHDGRVRGYGERIFMPLMLAMLIAVAYPILKHAHEAYEIYGFDVASIAQSHFAKIQGGKEATLDELILGISTAIYGLSGFMTAGFAAFFGMMYAYIKILNALFKRLFPRYE